MPRITGQLGQAECCETIRSARNTDVCKYRIVDSIAWYTPNASMEHLQRAGDTRNTTVSRYWDRVVMGPFPYSPPTQNIVGHRLFRRCTYKEARSSVQVIDCIAYNCACNSIFRFKTGVPPAAFRITYPTRFVSLPLGSPGGAIRANVPSASLIRVHICNHWVHRSHRRYLVGARQSGRTFRPHP